MALEREYKFPVWGTQGGGLVREVNGTYIFVEKPDCPGLDVGDDMPEEWGVIPANDLARGEMERFERGDDDEGICSFNDIAIDKEHAPYPWSSRY